MKTAISVPDDVFETVESFAHAAGRSRSEVYSAALREYMARHAPDQVTAAVNRVIEAIGDDAAMDHFSRAAARRNLERSER